jgi:hypothetical protein
MNCQNCDAPKDEAMPTCKLCGAVLVDASNMAKGGDTAPRTRRKILFWVCLNLALVWFIIGALFPTFETPIIIPNMAAVAMRGRDIYVAVIGTNTEREPLGLGPVWPKTQLKPGVDVSSGDIAVKIFTNSSDYFYELYDGPNECTTNHSPFAMGFDYSKLAGAGVPFKSGAGKLTPTNNVWIIAANITEEDDDRIPVLLTRNVDVKEIERVVNQGLKASEFKKRVTFGRGLYKTPFGKEGLVGIRKGGGMIKILRLSVVARRDRFGTHFFPSQTITLGELFDNKELPPRDPSKPPIVYLMP